jgi:hypothetical protein
MYLGLLYNKDWEQEILVPTMRTIDHFWLPFDLIAD